MHLKRIALKFLRITLDAIVFLKRVLEKPALVFGRFLSCALIFIFHPLFLLFYHLGILIRKLLLKFTPVGTQQHFKIFSRNSLSHLIIFILSLASIAANITAPEAAAEEYDTEMLVDKFFESEIDIDISEEFVTEEAGGVASFELIGPVAESEGESGQPISVSDDEISFLNAPTTAQGDTVLLKPTFTGTDSVGEEEYADAGEQKREKIEEYIVREGDTVSTIAARFGLKTTTILWANNLGVRDYIRPGDALKILPRDGVLHTIKKGGTLSQIALLYGVTVQTIQQYNNLSDSSILQSGQILLIPGAAKLPAPAPRTRSTLERIKDIIIPKKAQIPSGVQMFWPTPLRKINQYFTKRHPGLDIDGDYTSPIFASDDGKVVKAQGGWNGGYGLMIIIDHGNGIRTLYAHLSKLSVKVGDTVEKRQVIGMMGSTGRSTGTHVHFEVRVGGKRMNPFNYVQ